jgi:hypothetical protein
MWIKFNWLRIRQVAISGEYYSKSSVSITGRDGRAVVQVDSSRLPSAVARVQARLRSYVGSVVAIAALEQVLAKYFVFAFYPLIPPVAPQSCR